ncbi:MAG: WS/DGAT domain-containing protein [Angustibacter sp.]
MPAPGQAAPSQAPAPAGHHRERRLALADQAWLAVDQPVNPIVVTAVLQWDGPLSLAELRAVVTERLVRRYPSFTQRVRRARRRRPRWESDPQFDLDRHVVEIQRVADGPDGPGHTRPTPTCPDRFSSDQAEQDQTLHQLVGDLMGQPLDTRHAPWILHLTHDHQGQAVVVVRVHHCLADGMALAYALLGLADNPIPTHPRPQVRRRRPLARYGQVVRAVLGVAPTVLRLTMSAAEPRTSLRRLPTVRKVVSWTQPHPLDSVKQTARWHGVSLNDLLLAATAGGLRRCLLSQGQRPTAVRVVVPTDLRDGAPPTSLGNLFGLVFVRLPVDVADPAERMRQVAAQTRRIKRSAQAGSTWVVLSAIGLLPAVFAPLGLAILNRSTTAVVTNVPGPRERLWLGDVSLRSVVFWVPQVGRMALGLGIFSYAGTVTVGVACDASLKVDPAALAAAIDDEVTVLSDLLNHP